MDPSVDNLYQSNASGRRADIKDLLYPVGSETKTVLPDIKLTIASFHMSFRVKPKSSATYKRSAN